MKTTPLLSTILLATCALAQSPLTTSFTSGTFLSQTGATVYFDLDVRTAVAVTQMDVNFYGTPRPNCGIAIWIRSGTHVGTNSSSAGWTQVANVTGINSLGRDVPTPVPLPTPFVLTPGLTGVAVQHIGTGAAYGIGTSVGAIAASTAEMDLREGGTSGSLFTGTVNSPRVMNCSIHYQPATGFATATPFGTSCSGMSLTSARPVAGTTMSLTAINVPGGSVFGVLALSPSQLVPGLQPIPGLGNCMLHVGLDSIIGFVPGGTTSTLTIPIPATGFNGFTFHGQVLTLSPSANPAGIASTNGMTWTVDAN